jgi:tRNA threonylcarbamoyladenosine biosynthesis protein TsaB
MSYILGIDTSSGELGLGLANEHQSLLGISRYMRNSHAEHISSGVEFLLSSCGICAADITHVAVSVGPGSFTGLRIGISFVKGFCLCRDVKVLPVSSLECIALAWNNREKPIIAALDARNGDVFWARFTPKGIGLERTDEDALTSADRLAQCLDADCTIVTDTLGNTKSCVFDFLRQRPGVYALERFPVQRGLACTHAAIASYNDPLKWVNAGALTPQYLTVTTVEKKLQEQTHETMQAR